MEGKKENVAFWKSKKTKRITGRITKRREEEWKKEREREKSERIGKEMGGGIEFVEGEKGVRDLEQRMEKMKSEKRGKDEREEGRRGLEERVRKMEEMWEGKEKKWRKRLVIKGYKTGDKDARSKIKEIIKRVSADVKVKEVREVKTGKEEQGGLR